MNSLTYTLLTDGSSDRSLIPILNWLLYRLLPDWALQPNYADLRDLLNPPKGMPDRIRTALYLFPCQILFIHRDAEGFNSEDRVTEINTAVFAIGREIQDERLHHVCVIPVRMTEAWLLIDEYSLRRAADNPAGRTPLALPPLSRLEDLPNPKVILYDLLRCASGCSGRRLKQFNANIGIRVHRLSDLIRDFTPLLQLKAFRCLEEDTAKTLQKIGYR